MMYCLVALFTPIFSYLSHPTFAIVDEQHKKAFIFRKLVYFLVVSLMSKLLFDTLNKAKKAIGNSGRSD